MSSASANGELKESAKANAELHNEKLLNLFNFITLPFYWGRFEPKRGQPDTAVDFEDRQMVYRSKLHREGTSPLLAHGVG